MANIPSKLEWNAIEKVDKDQSLGTIISSNSQVGTNLERISIKAHKKM